MFSLSRLCGKQTTFLPLNTYTHTHTHTKFKWQLGSQAKTQIPLENMSWFTYLQHREIYSKLCNNLYGKGSEKELVYAQLMTLAVHLTRTRYKPTILLYTFLFNAMG